VYYFAVTNGYAIASRSNTAKLTNLFFNPYPLCSKVVSNLGDCCASSARFYSARSASCWFALMLIVIVLPEFASVLFLADMRSAGKNN